MATFTWIGANPFPSLWTDPTNWQVGGAATVIAPNDPTAIVIATANGTDGFEYPIISGGAAIRLASLSSAGIAHILVGGSQLGGTGSATLTADTISVTSTALGGGLVGGPGSTITTASMTVGAGAIIGGGGTFNVTSLVNSGTIQADGANFNLGALTVTGGAITGTGSIEVDGPSTLDLGSATAETITVVVAPTETATIVFENPGSFTGALNLFNPQSHVNLFFKGQTPTGATFDNTTNSLIITGASGQIDKIPFGGNISVFATPASTRSGFGEVSIGPTDTTAPTAPGTPVLATADDSGTSSTDNITNFTGLPSFRGSGEDSATVTLRNGAAVIGTAIVAGGVWSITATIALAQGANAITATQTDRAGNTSAASATLNVTVDTTAPAVTSVTASPSDAVLGAGAAVTLTLGFSEAVTVAGGTPTLTLNNGGTATYASGSGTNALTFDYAVAGGQDTPDLAVTDASLNGATITDQAGNAAGLAGMAASPLGAIQITTATLGLPVFRFFDTHDGGHFFTTSTTERDQVQSTRSDMNFEGVGYNAVDPASNDHSGAPVFRFFDTHDGGHFFTTSTAERDQVVATRKDMNFEGVSYSEHTSQEAGDAPVYRFFETTSGGHFFTASAAERDTVQATRSDMRFEGIAFFAPT